MGPEKSLQEIFNKARQFAPCYLVFEDLDTVISPDVRSYFLNEVDGLKNNDGVFIIGSTNHLERLDPGIAVSISLQCKVRISELRAPSYICNLRNGHRGSIASIFFPIRILNSASHTAISGRRSLPTTRI
jgi:hypothetical protein